MSVESEIAKVTQEISNYKILIRKISPPGHKVGAPVAAAFAKGLDALYARKDRLEAEQARLEKSIAA